MKITIGLSRGSGSPKYENYGKWLSTLPEYDVEVLDLSVGDLDADLQRIDGLVLTGGGDIDPSLYDREDARSLCDGIDPERDRMESAMVDYCTENRIPILGICRGLQFMNVHLGGSLVPHIPDDPDAGGYHTNREGEDNRHEITVEPGSLLYRAVGELDGEVNSSHHQGVRQVPAELAVSARSADGMVEAVEWREPEQKNYMVAVQWHPERMERESPFSRGLLEGFLLEAASAAIFKRSTPPEPKEEPEEWGDGEHEGDQPKEGGDGFSLPIIQ